MHLSIYWLWLTAAPAGCGGVPFSTLKKQMQTQVRKQLNSWLADGRPPDELLEEGLLVQVGGDEAREARRGDEALVQLRGRLDARLVWLVCFVLFRVWVGLGSAWFVSGWKKSARRRLAGETAGRPAGPTNQPSSVVKPLKQAQAQDKPKTDGWTDLERPRLQPCGAPLPPQVRRRGPHQPVHQRQRHGLAVVRGEAVPQPLPDLGPRDLRRGRVLGGVAEDEGAALVRWLVG